MSFIETRTLREGYSCVLGDPFFSQKCPYGLGGRYSLTGWPPSHLLFGRTLSQGRSLSLTQTSIYMGAS